MEIKNKGFILKHMRINKLIIKRGGQEVNLCKLNVLIGPNNSGKSRTLRDICNRMIQADKTKSIIIDKIDFKTISSFNELTKDINQFDVQGQPGYKKFEGLNYNLTGIHEPTINEEYFINDFKISSNNLESLLSLANVGPFHISFLDASSRLKIAQTTESYDTSLHSPTNILQVLYSNRKIEKKLKKIFFEAFKMRITLDVSNARKITLLVAKRFYGMPNTINDIRDRAGDSATTPKSKYNKLDDQGDGFKSFAGVVLGLLCSKNRIILLDEPEAFLHPTQARILGKWISDFSKEAKGQIIIATHNSNFISGMLSGKQKDVCIYRLNREENKTTYCKLEPKTALKLRDNPLLSNQRILEALFYRGVIVCEGDSDRCIYQTVAVKEFTNHEVLFVHAHNKQTIYKVVDLLNEAMVSVCAIVDFDIFNQTKDFKNLANSFNITIRKGTKRDGAIKYLSTLKKRDWNDIKAKGLKAIRKKYRIVIKRFLSDLEKRGLFVVKFGELESWIEVGSNKKKERWIVKALGYLYEKGCPKNLKNFIFRILQYID